MTLEMAELLVNATNLQTLIEVLDQDPDPEIRLFSVHCNDRHTLGLVHPKKGFYDALVSSSSQPLHDALLLTFFKNFVPEADPPEFPLADFEGANSAPTFYRRPA